MEDILPPQLAAEAVFIGATLVPVWVIWNALLGTGNDVVKIFATGASYHLISEWSGLNNHYLENSHASNLRYGDLVKQHFRLRSNGGYLEDYRFLNHQY